jgi:predicted ester cyclase
MRGTHKGAFMGKPPTSRPIQVQGIIIVRVVDGRIVENWLLVDQMSILQQLGIIPPPGH